MIFSRKNTTSEIFQPILTPSNYNLYFYCSFNCSSCLLHFVSSKMKGIRSAVFQETGEHFSFVAQTQTIGSCLLSLSNKEKAVNGLPFACSSPSFIYSWFIDLLFLLHYYPNSWVVAYFEPNKVYFEAKLNIFLNSIG